MDVVTGSYYLNGNQLFILISIMYDFQPCCLLRKVIEATDAFSGIGGIEINSGCLTTIILPPPTCVLTSSSAAVYKEISAFLPVV